MTLLTSYPLKTRSLDSDVEEPVPRRLRFDGVLITWYHYLLTLNGSAEDGRRVRTRTVRPGRRPVCKHADALGPRDELTYSGDVVACVFRHRRYEQHVD